MSSRRTVRQLVVAVLAGILVGGGLMAVTPAGAEVSSALATNWKKIWNKELKPQADKRYYTKKKSDKRYQAKGDYALNGSSYTKAETYSKAEADAKYQPKGNYEPAGSGYTKAESDARYRRSTELVRGNTLVLFSATGAGQYGAADISFGSTFSEAPAVHIIPVGGVPPVGCSGSPASPDAAPGNLCIFETYTAAASGLTTCKPSTASCSNTADPWGTVVYASSTAAGAAQNFAVWAARPSAVASTAAGRQAPASPSDGPGPRGVQ